MSDGVKSQTDVALNLTGLGWTQASVGQTRVDVALNPADVGSTEADVALTDVDAGSTEASHGWTGADVSQTDAGVVQSAVAYIPDPVALGSTTVGVGRPTSTVV